MYNFFSTPDKFTEYHKQGKLEDDIRSVFSNEAVFDGDENYNYQLWLQIRLTHDNEVEVWLNVIDDHKGDLPDKTKYKYEFETMIKSIYCDIPQEWYENYFDSNKERLTEKFNLTDDDWSNPMRYVIEKIDDQERNAAKDFLEHLYIDQIDLEYEIPDFSPELLSEPSYITVDQLAPHWVSVDDRLPREGRRVLGITKKRAMNVCILLTDENDYTSWYDPNSFLHIPVIAWTELPQITKED